MRFKARVMSFEQRKATQTEKNVFSAFEGWTVIKTGSGLTDGYVGAILHAHLSALGLGAS